MKKRFLRQVAGIDVAHRELVVSLGHMDEETATKVYAYKVFPNTQRGFASLVSWVEKQAGGGCPVRYVMEATGVYHEALAYYLAERGCPVSIVMPNKITNFFRTLEVKTVTDKSMSEAIALFGLSKTLENWARPQAIFRELRQLTRERDQLLCERTMLKNQLHAEQLEAYPSRTVIARMRSRIKMVTAQIKECLEETTAAIKGDERVAESVRLITTIPGIGTITAAVIMAETNGFELIRSRKQLTSYAGLDVREKESGTSVKGKPRISKRGNRFLRKAMYMPAMAAIRHSPRYKDIFVRIVCRNGVKMKGCVAVQRKLLELAYTIHKTKTQYRPDYPEAQQIAVAEYC